MKMESQIRLIDIDQIIPNRFQPRLQFDENALTELAASIKEHGIIQPLVLRRLNDKYEIIAGERRYKASKLIGLTEVPAIIANLDDNESAEVAIIENTHRKNLSAIEEAKSYKKLLERHYVTQDQLAKRLGTSQSNIANKVRLLSLDETVQKALIEEKISERHARSLLRLTDKVKQKEMLDRTISERWPVKKLDEEIDAIIGSYNKYSYTGEVNTNGRYDLNVQDVINNSKDIVVETPLNINPFSNYVAPKPIKESILFNNLENEAANMGQDPSFGFNPFKSSNVNQLGIIEILDDEEEKTEEKGETLSKKREINTKDDVIDAINEIISIAKEKNITLDFEKFDFNNLYQYIIRIKK